MKIKQIKSKLLPAAAALMSAAVLGCTLALPVLAAEQPSAKEEVVYAIADAAGTVNELYVVNIFGAGDVTDYGDYTAVKMLNTTDAITQNGDTVTFSTDAERAYYQGDMATTQIPWDINLIYKLDGKIITAEELAGKSGHLQIHFTIGENTAYNGPDFYNNYAVQATLTLDSLKCSNIVAENATVANVGSDKQLSYTVLPGKGLDSTIEMDVVSFEMPAAAINAVPLSLDIEVDTGELTDKTAELKDGVQELDDGANELADGARELDDGAHSLTDGVGELTDGARDLADGASDLDDGAGELADGVSELKNGGLSLAEGATALNDGAKSLQGAITGELTNGALELTNGATALESGLTTLNGNSAALVEGGYQAFCGLCSAAQSQLNAQLTANGMEGVALTPETYAATLQALLDSLGGEIYRQVEAAVREQVTAAVQKQVEQAVAAQAEEAYKQYILGQIDDAQKSSVYTAAAAQAVAQQYRQSKPDATDEEIQAYLATAEGQAAVQAAVESMSEEQKQAALNAAAEQQAAALSEEQKAAILQGAVEQTMQTEAVQAQLEAAASEQMASAEVQAKLAEASGMTEALTSLKAQLDSFNTFYTALQSYTGAVASAAEGAAGVRSGSQALYEAIAGELAAGANSLADGAETLANGVASLNDGVDSLSGGTAELKDGTTRLKDGTVTLTDGTTELADGTAELTDGTARLLDGTTELTDGTAELKDKTGDIDVQIEDKINETIDELSGSGEAPGSFVSAKNTNVKAVQFIIKTAAIELPEVEEAAEEEAQPLTFWQKLLALFGL